MFINYMQINKNKSNIRQRRGRNGISGGQFTQAVVFCVFWRTIIQQLVNSHKPLYCCIECIVGRLHNSWSIHTSRYIVVLTVL